MRPLEWVAGIGCLAAMAAMFAAALVLLFGGAWIVWGTVFG